MSKYSSSPTASNPNISLQFSFIISLFCNKTSSLILRGENTDNWRTKRCSEATTLTQVFKVLFVISREKIVVQDTSKLIFAHGFLCHLAQHSLETPS